MLSSIGVLPIRRHYYEPYVDRAELYRPLSEVRPLPAIDLNVEGQLLLLGKLRFAAELSFLAAPRDSEFRFGLNNGSFESGDAEYLYQLIRYVKPRRIFEIGSGNSTLMVAEAIRANSAEAPEYRCQHLCIEPFEAPWLEKIGVETIRKRVEHVDREIFRALEENDILFIDSSHVIRPQGDVLTEYLEVLPILRKGVIVHVHDIFTPRDYPEDWVLGRRWLWNEQYLLEAFLANNEKWKVIGALNYLMHSHPDALRAVCPFVEPSREPGSFYMQKVG